ncbi:hypothetical protein DmAi_24460 [Acetobacter persici]|uniref:Uncharacterized protein n=2 Tax=Acetobacter persici TaxID=1076596 RepID=A0A6V8IBF0_9PROT|nr:hypothetical protein DmAi_24460 [Acetobacter persici]
MTVDASQDTDLLFKIEGFKLSSLSLSRVRTYILLLNNLVGKQKEGVHLSFMQNGSLEAALSIESNTIQKTRDWLYAASSPLGGEPRRALESLRKAIREDGGTGATLWDISAQELILTIDPQEDTSSAPQIFSQKDTLRGRITTLGEAGTGRGYTGIIGGHGKAIRFTYEDSIAPLLKPLLWMGTVELSGDAKWSRDQEGQWKLIYFEATSVRELQQNNLKVISARIRKNGGFGFKEKNLSKFLKDVR